jgi:type IV secretory pathway VirB2 component (pilin)
MGHHMKFFKENSYDIVKLFINQMGITIFSLVLYTAIGFIDDEVLNLRVKVILSVFATIFYFALLYTATWEFGAKDKIRIDSGKALSTPTKGLKMSLLANIPNFILAVFAIAFMGIYMLGGNEWFYSAFFVLNMLIRFISAMFLGLIQGIFSFLATDDPTNASFCPYYFWQTVGFFVGPILSVIVTHFGYKMGSLEKKLFGFLVPSKKK